MGEPRNYSGVVVNRSNIQILLLDLYDFAKHPESRKKLAENRFDRSVFAFLVGAAFSLWRAAFLTETKRDWPSILEHATAFLDRLVADNAIAYTQEKSTLEWSVGYYLNNACFRIASILDDFAPDLRPNPAQEEALRRFQAQNTQSIVETDANEIWQLAYGATRAIFDMLVTQSAKRGPEDKP